MKYFFTSDTHFGHEKIITYCNRPFKNLKEMDETLIRKWNEKVKPEDIVFHLGDFCFKGGLEGGDKKYHEYADRLNGKIILVKGNHDSNNSAKTIIEGILVYHGGYKILLIHSPADATPGLNFVGHVHTLWDKKREGKTIMINVGVDVNNFAPVTIEDLNKKYGKLEDKK